MSPHLWINDANKKGQGYFKPAENIHCVDALARTWRRRLGEAVGVAFTFAIIAAVVILAVFWTHGGI